jgi:hypothetical protein
MDVSFKLSLPNDVLVLLTIIATLLGIFKGLQEYIKQGREKRAQTFFQLEKEFFEKEITRQICKLLETDSVELKNISYEDKIKFIGFFEKIALLINSDLLKKEIAFYVYGFYIEKCSVSVNFWDEELDKNSPYWELFHQLSYQLKEINIDKISIAKLSL